MALILTDIDDYQTLTIEDNTIRIYRYGRVVNVVIVGKTKTSTSSKWETLGVLPNWARPTTITRFAGYNNYAVTSDKVAIPFQIQIDGTVQYFVYADSLTVVPIATVTYVI